ncbi:MAG: hypothetical protein JSS04_24385 [Proteobacteria bacterium]|nr:hypothetical protein [Pseudomonadota bacterium]
MTRWAWPAAAALAFAFLVGLALHGGRPDIMVQFKPGGLMSFAPEQAREIEIRRGTDRRHFVRSGERWDAPVETSERLEAGLRLLRNAAPMRLLTAEEVARVPPSEYALGADSLRVTVRPEDGAAFVIQFGGTNPLGAARYAKVDGEAGVALVPTYVAEAWEQVR